MIYFCCPYEQATGNFQLFIYIYYGQRLTHQREEGKLKNWDPEIGHEPKPWIKLQLSFKQVLLVERVLFVNLC